MLDTVAVVIPFFQTERGILERALQSIVRQRDVGRIHVIVVDDSSPVDPTPTVEAMPKDSQVTFEVVSRANGGPAAARNTGLDRVPDDTRYVAFLDSDDQWSENHLSRAMLALSQGFDVYFADLYQIEQSTSAFVRTGRISRQAHVPLARGGELFAYQGDMFDQIIRGNVIGTPTVVFDRLRFPDVRFREEYFSAGEDYLCWMGFARQGARFAFSTAIEASCGRGINVYSGVQWGTARHMKRVHDEFRYRKASKDLYGVDADQEQFIQGKMAELRAEFVLDVLHMIRRRKLPSLKLLSRQIRLDPRTAIAPFEIMFARLFSRMTHPTA